MKKILFGMTLLLFSIGIYIAEASDLWMFEDAEMLPFFISLFGLAIAAFGLFDKEDK